MMRDRPRDQVIVSTVLLSGADQKAAGVDKGRIAGGSAGMASRLAEAPELCVTAFRRLCSEQRYTAYTRGPCGRMKVTAVTAGVATRKATHIGSDLFARRLCAFRSAAARAPRRRTTRRAKRSGSQRFLGEFWAWVRLRARVLQGLRFYAQERCRRSGAFRLDAESAATAG